MITRSPHPSFKDKKERLEMIKTFFGLVRRGITESNVLVEIYSLDELEAAINSIGAWNTFKPSEILEAAKEIWETTGETVQIGFEGSPVIYLTIPIWTSQIRKNKHLRRPLTQEEFYKVYNVDSLGKPLLKRFQEISRKMAEITGSRRLTEEERESIKDRIFEAFEATDPTEADYKEDHRFPARSFSIRLWWD